MTLTMSDRGIGPKTDPQDIRGLRQSAYDFHDQLGQVVVLKHRWNERDLRNGLVKQCPLHNDLYDNDLATCPFCFGTSYLGGYADGILTHATIADAKEDTFRLTEQGLMLHDRSPQVSFPWQPLVGDDDLLITVELDPDTGQIQDTYDYFTLRQASPVTVRGTAYKNTSKSRPFVVGQQAQVDIVPYGSILREVPIVFDYSKFDDDNIIPLPNGYSLISHEISVRLTGEDEGFETSYSQDVRVAVAGTETSITQDARLIGGSGGTHVFVD